MRQLILEQKGTTEMPRIKKLRPVHLSHDASTTTAQATDEKSRPTLSSGRAFLTDMHQGRKPPLQLFPHTFFELPRAGQGMHDVPVAPRRSRKARLFLPSVVLAASTGPVSTREGQWTVLGRACLEMQCISWGRSDSIVGPAFLQLEGRGRHDRR